MDWNALWTPLEGPSLVLAPTGEGDVAELAASADAATFAHFSDRPADASIEEMARFIKRIDAQPYTMRHRDTGEVVGCSSFLDRRPAHRAVEIGFTWIAPAWRGTAVNPEAKLLMLRHGFETLQCVRVQLKCDARNERSAAAIRKLGSVYEGRLRNHAIMPDGYVRDTLMFSVTDEEWPQVRAGLERRLLG